MFGESRLCPRAFSNPPITRGRSGLSLNITQVIERRNFSAKDAKNAKEGHAKRTSSLCALALFAFFASFADNNAVRRVADSLMRE